MAVGFWLGVSCGVAVVFGGGLWFFMRLRKQLQAASATMARLKQLKIQHDFGRLSSAEYRDALKRLGASGRKQ